MKTSDFNFELPKELIAQTPLFNRSASKLMVLDKKNETISHHHFDELVNFLGPNDLLVMNNTKVIPARLFGTKEETNAHVELLILKIVENKAECLVGNAKVVKIGTVITFGEGLLKAVCVEVKDEGLRVFELIYEGILMELLDTLGEMPLPPYIHEKLEDRNRYQTVYAKVEGSAAAPTAGLHFTPELLKQIKDKGISIAEITLHVGLGTFRPVKVDDINDHVMHDEEYEVSEEVASLLNSAKRIVAAGTTTTRVLEAQMSRYGKFVSEQSSTDIFIYPGYQFKAIDALITNFHLPESTLLMLVSAFSNKEFIMKAYQEAISNEYRFFSFGDSMLIK